MTDALADSGMALSPFLYGGIGVALVMIAGLFLLFRRKARLQLKQSALQKSYSNQALEQPAVNLENMVPPDVAEPQGSPIPEEQQPVEDSDEHLGEELTAVFRMAASSQTDDIEEEPGPAGDQPNQEIEFINKDDSPDGSQKQHQGQDSMLDLFTAEVTEDSNIGKLAASLDNVEIEDIMGDAQDLIQKLRGKK